MFDLASFALSNEPTLRLSIFAGVLALMAVWELVAPKRRVEIPRLLRWTNNLALVALDSVLVRLIFPVTAVALAAQVQSKGWGLLNVLAVPEWLGIVVAVLLLDLIIYAQHVTFHVVPWFWRVHRVHHADTEFDVTTGLRFHPVEILLSMMIKFAAIIVLGAPAIAVLIFEVVLNATAMFNHSNTRLPHALQSALRYVVVTPDMHRIHHSVHPEETNSNYGFNLPWWDRMFGTFRSQAREDQTTMQIGLNQFRNKRNVWLHRLLLIPFIRSDKT